MTTTAQHQERVLCGKEEELVRVLSGKDPMEIADNLHRRHVISDTMWDLFASLDHSRLERQLQIRYLLRLVCKKLIEDNSVWTKFLKLLAGMGGNFNTMRKELEGELDKVTSSVDICPLTSTANEKPDIILTTSDAEDLTECLVGLSYKWEELGIALKLTKCARENCRHDKNIISLSNVITSWLSGEASTLTNTTLHTLKKALCGPIVAEPKIAEELGERFLSRLSLSSEDTSDSYSNVTIINQSSNTMVADGGSILLLVQASPRESASYQWKKDGYVLVDSSTYTGVDDEILVISRARQGTEGEYTCCVSSEGRQECSNKIILTVEYSPAKKRLLNSYSDTDEVPSDCWPPSGTKTFINLVLIKSSKELTYFTDYTVEGSADKVIAEREKVEYEQVFSECKSGELILLKGRPGSGKTTLVHKIIKDWTKGRVLVNARWAILITLREINNIRAESLYDVLSYCNQYDEDIAKNIEHESGEGLCFIIDGLDEYQPPDKTKSPIYQLLNEGLVPKATIIVSSRPSATKDLNWRKLTKAIEIIGFDKEDIFEYVDNFLFCSESDINSNAMYVAKVKDYLHSNPNVLNMCYLPVHTAMICFLFKCKSENIPITQTKMYEEFTCCIILRHLKHFNSEEQLESLRDLRGNNKKDFDELCRQAFEMTVNSEQIVIPQKVNVQLSDSSVPETTRYLGLVTISHTAKLSGFHSTCTFLHLTFQEFLAAFYIASLNVADQLKIVKKCKNLELSTLLTFYCGLVQFNREDKRIQALFKNEHDVVLLIKYAFESQQPTVCNEVVKDDLNLSDMTTFEISAFNYVLSSISVPITKLSLTFSGDDAKTAVEVLKINKIKLCHLQELIIHVKNNHQMFLLSELLNISSYLTKANLRLEHVDPDGMKSLAPAFKSLSYLQVLHLRLHNISGGITNLCNGIQHIQQLHLSCENCDVVDLGKGLQQLNTNSLCYLALNCGRIGAEGAHALAKGLRNHTKLQSLFLCSNGIGDDEMDSLSSGIKLLLHLNKLDLSHNNIGPHGAARLADAIQHLHLVCLDLSSNKIGSKGAITLANAIQHLNQLAKLYLSGNNIDFNGAITVIKALKNCPCDTAFINEQVDRLLEGFQLQGLVSPDDNKSIATLVAAAQHKILDRELHLGFKTIKVPSKSSQSKQNKTGSCSVV